MEKTNETLFNFLNGIKNDPFMGAVHIALYMAIFRKWIERGCEEPIPLASKELMGEAKIYSSITYYRALRQLDNSGYIVYVPSYNKMKSSEIYVAKSNFLVR